MIYFDNKLEFKENYEVATEFETHPHYLPNGKMAPSKVFSTLNIPKDNFIENIAKIKQKLPTFVYQLLILFIIFTILITITLTLRFVQFNTLYSSVKEQELISQEIIDRKNLLSNIGSLAVYFSKASTYPTVW